MFPVNKAEQSGSRVQCQALGIGVKQRKSLCKSFGFKLVQWTSSSPESRNAGGFFFGGGTRNTNLNVFSVPTNILMFDK